MKYKRGDVILIFFPFTSGAGAKVRPALVVQNDTSNRRLHNLIVAGITTTVHRSGEPTQFLIELSSIEGPRAGLVQDSVVSCENLATLHESLVRGKIGDLSPVAMRTIDDCLKAALGIQ